MVVFLSPPICSQRDLNATMCQFTQICRSIYPQKCIFQSQSFWFAQIVCHDFSLKGDTNNNRCITIWWLWSFQAVRLACKCLPNYVHIQVHQPFQWLLTHIYGAIIRVSLIKMVIKTHLNPKNRIVYAQLLYL